MSREKSVSDREVAKQRLATATDEELHTIIKAKRMHIDVRGPYPVVMDGMKVRKCSNYKEALQFAASIALGLTKW